jgi:hypothetical protein
MPETRPNSNVSFAIEGSAHCHDLSLTRYLVYAGSVTSRHQPPVLPEGSLSTMSRLAHLPSLLQLLPRSMPTTQDIVGGEAFQPNHQLSSLPAPGPYRHSKPCVGGPIHTYFDPSSHEIRIALVVENHFSSSGIFPSTILRAARFTWPKCSCAFAPWPTPARRPTLSTTSVGSSRCQRARVTFVLAPTVTVKTWSLSTSLPATPLRARNMSSSVKSSPEHRTKSTFPGLPVSASSLL